jgi:Domain of unknown function (DUF4328)
MMSNSWQAAPPGYGAPVGPPRNPALVEYGAAPAGYATPYPSGRYGPYGAPLPPARLRGLAGALRLLLALDAVAALGLLGALVWERDTIAAIHAGEAVTVRHALTVDGTLSTAEWVNLGALVVTGIVFIAWLYRVRSNADYLGGYQQRRAKGWAVFGWFVPVVCLFYPFQLVVDAAREARAAASRDGGSIADFEGLILGWWLAYLFGGFLRVRFFALDDDTTLALPVTTQLALMMGSAALTALAALLAISVVGRVSAAQARVMGGA